MYAGENYIYQVAAIQDNLTSEFSNIASVTVPRSRGVPAKPHSVRMRRLSVRRLQMRWIAPPGGQTGYEIQRLNGDVWQQVADIEADQTSYTITVRGAYRIRAFNDDGFSEWAYTATNRLARLFRRLKRPEEAL